jgi:hypothetical protein
MAFTLGKLRYVQAVNAYKYHARVHGLPVQRIRESLCRREQSGNWVLANEHGTVATVTLRLRVTVASQSSDEP